jgi:ubiquinone/menaquinone biosynthesis C-methylase UbiE
MNKSKIHQEFGSQAESYVTSKTHAQGTSLRRLVELIPTEKNWKVLDIASATGHTAFTIAPHVAHVWATDITPEMLAIAKQQSVLREIVNVTVEYADAEDLPYEDSTFHLVTCRIAPHHFLNVGRFLQETFRVLLPGGFLGLVDNIVPPGPVGDYINAFEKLRDPSHERCLSMPEWVAQIEAAGLHLSHKETVDKEIDFVYWTRRHNPRMKKVLMANLEGAIGETRSFLQPRIAEDNITFYLREGIFIAQRVA